MTNDTPAVEPSKASKTDAGTTNRKQTAKPAQAKAKPNATKPDYTAQIQMLRHLRKQHGMVPTEARIQMGYGVPARATATQNADWDAIVKLEAGQ